MRSDDIGKVIGSVKDIATFQGRMSTPFCPGTFWTAVREGEMEAEGVRVLMEKGMREGALF